MDYVLLEGDSLQMLKEMDDNSVDSICTDAPYGLGKEPDANEVMKDWVEKGYHEIKSKGGFMGKAWDSFVPQPLFWKEAYRVLKPGGYVLCFFGTRTYDWGVMAMRFAGFEIRDQIQWLYGSGFPKSMDISKAIDKAAGAEREVIGQNHDILTKQAKDLREGKRKIVDSLNAGASERNNGFSTVSADITAPSTEEAKQWEGWGTALKPANEPIVLARKPLAESTVAENVLKHGTGGINIDGCRIATEDKIPTTSNQNIKNNSYKSDNSERERDTVYEQNQLGRFPTNLILDEEAAKMLDEQSGIRVAGNFPKVQNTKSVFMASQGTGLSEARKTEAGGASRFFYVAKASKKERNAGLEGFEEKITTDGREKSIDNPFLLGETGRLNNHPTVKPISLMRYLVRLITPKGGICLDPYNGSGTTGCACALEDIDYIGIDNEPDYIKISEARIEYWKKETQRIINK